MNSRRTDIIKEVIKNLIGKKQYLFNFVDLV